MVLYLFRLSDHQWDDSDLQNILIKRRKLRHRFSSEKYCKKDVFIVKLRTVWAAQYQISLYRKFLFFVLEKYF